MEALDQADEIIEETGVGTEDEPGEKDGDHEKGDDGEDEIKGDGRGHVHVAVREEVLRPVLQDVQGRGRSKGEIGNALMIFPGLHEIGSSLDGYLTPA